jgi:DNA polymerase (family 10)
MENHDVAGKLREIGLFHEMDGIPFKPAAFERAADAVETHPEPMRVILRRGGRKALMDVEGVGEGIARDIEDFLKRRVPPDYKRLKKRYPVDILGLTAVESVGPKTVRLLYKELGVRTVRQLEKAAQQGKIRGLPGMGAKSEERILAGLRVLASAGDRKLLGDILPIATALVEDIRAVPGVKHAELAGSARRRQETVGDLDIIVTAKDHEAVMAAFSGFPEVKEVLEHGATKTVVRLRNGMHADVRVVADDEFGAALQYYTGSKDHNVVVRGMAAAKGMKLNEYGLWKGSKRLASRTEEDVYRALGLPYVEPELRTDTGEIDAAKAKKLPKLVAYGAVRGDLQTQTTWTDGTHSIEEMAEAAYANGLEYIAITDHTKALAMTGGLDEKRLAEQGREIDRLNASFAKRARPFRILKGTEMDILKDGSLDLSDAALAKLDFVGASVHSHFGLSPTQQTARIIRAMENPHVDAIFHPTCRIIGKRDPIALDMPALIAAAKRTGTLLEIDAMPGRSDLRDAHVRMAVEAGVQLVIDTDAHATQHLGFLDLGVAIARRGWATKKDIVNTKPLDEFLRWIRTKKSER